MILNGQELPAGTVLDARFCVIGSGMGGSAVAHLLARAHRDVILIEAGGTERVDAKDAPVSAEHVGRPFNAPVTRCIELGGTSNQWHGACASFDELDFEPRPWISGSGWPIRKSDLAPFYSQAVELLELAAHPDSDTWPQRGERDHGIDFDAEFGREKVVRFRRPPKRWKSDLLALGQRPNVRIVLNATALELRARPDSPSVEDLVIGLRAGTGLVRAQTFILCAGTLETPRVLLNSRRRHPAGLGNGHGLVGRNLLDHPIGHFSKIRFRRPAPAPLFSNYPVGNSNFLMGGLRLHERRQREIGLGNHSVWVRPSVTAARMDDELILSFLKARTVKDLSLRQISAMITNRDVLYRVLVQRFGVRPKYRYGDLFFMTEQLPNPDSRVTLSERVSDRHGYPVARIDWRLSDEDLKGFAQYTACVFNHFLRSEQYEVARMDDLAIWERTVASAAHHLGTARMAAEPSQGVVDRDLKVFDTANLFICDGSVFSTAGGINPSMTISALGARLADHLLRTEAA